MARSNKTGEISPAQANKLLFSQLKKLNNEMQEQRKILEGMHNPRAVSQKGRKIRKTAQEILDECGV